MKGHSEMFRFVTVLLLSALVSDAHAGTKFTDNRGRFSVVAPEGWQSTVPEKNEHVTFYMAKSIENSGTAVCVFFIRETPETNSKSQAEIDHATSAELTKEYWERLFRSVGNGTVNIKKHGSRDAVNRKIHYVVVDYATIYSGDEVVYYSAHDEIHALPGAMHSPGCLTNTPDYEAFASDFDAILNSYTPQSGLIARAPAKHPSVATLYAGANFDGTARVVGTAIPDVAALGWPQQTGSFAVSGYGEWQVCEGTNYTGKCSVLVGTNPGVKIGSLRPVTPPSLRGIASAISTETVLLLNEAKKRLRSQ